MVTDSENGKKPEGLALAYTPNGRNGKVTVTARLAGEPVACESFDLTKPKARASFAATVAAADNA